MVPKVQLEPLNFGKYFYVSFIKTKSEFIQMCFLSPGTAGDSLGYHRGLPFTTKDRDNDRNSGNCVSYAKGGWLYNSCRRSNLNGLYLHGKISDEGVGWYDWKKTGTP